MKEEQLHGSSCEKKKKNKRKTQRDLIDAVIGIACRQLGVTQD